MWEFIYDRDNELKLSKLTVDQAYANITSHISSFKVWLYMVSEECIKCPFSYVKYGEIGPLKRIVQKFKTTHPVSWQVFDKDYGKYALTNDTPLCSINKPNVGEFGIYNLDIYDERCEFNMVQEPVNIYLSLLYVIIIICLTSTLIYVSNKIYGKYIKSRLISQSTASLDTELDKPKTTKPRMKSLDTFRGIAIALMIFVNNGGGEYWWMDHSTWNGLYVADLVFPWFLWIMGVCIPLSIKSQINRNVPKRTMIKRVFFRSLKLFFIGLCLNTVHAPTDFISLRIMGVLQRFGICYFVVTTLHILLSRPIDFLPQSNLRRAFYDIKILLWQWLVMLAIIVIYAAITFGLPVPDCPKGYLGPGGFHEMGKYFYCTGGAAGYIDRNILGVSHLYQHARIKSVYGSQSFDPEGLFGCLMSVFHVFLGVQCGMTLIIFSQWKERVKRWLLWAILLGLAAGALCSFSQDDGLIPINKHLWSLSYVFATSSLAFILLTLCYITIDVRPIWSGCPFLYAGMNAIILYIGHSVAHSMLPWRWSIGLMNTHFMLLLEAVWCSALWVLVAYYLYYKKIFYSV